MVIYWHRQPNLYFLLHKRIVWQMNFARFFSVYEMRSSSSVIRLSLSSTWNISLFKFKKVNFSIPFRVKLLFPSTPLRHAQAIELYRYNVWGSGCVAQLVERSYIEHTVNCIEKMKIKKKRPRLAHIKKNGIIGKRKGLSRRPQQQELQQQRRQPQQQQRPNFLIHYQMPKGKMFFPRLCWKICFCQVALPSSTMRDL